MQEHQSTGVIQPLPGIGDMIWYLPALKAIAADAPDGKITLFTRSSSQARVLLGAEPMISSVIDLPIKKRGFLAALPNFFRTWWTLFRARPDRLFILHQSSRYRLAARCAFIREIIAYPPAVAKAKKDGWQKSLSFLQQQNIPVADPYSHLAVDAASLAAVCQRFVPYPQPWLIVAPGGSTAERLWPIDRFAFCADALAEMSKGTVFLIGSARESKMLAEVHHLCRHADQIIPVSGLPFDQIMGLMASSKCLFGNDSGPANVAAAIGCPAFSLCGTSAPPLHSPNLHLIMPDLPPDAGRGMLQISAQHVLDEMRSVLKV